ncbi:Uncharacterised protein [Vibrio cholerae]|nr:Uncharacterised protein [Vibrio cholerae]CSI54043.1 Uncharacterised protein [Vibrio cholerae]
MRNWQISRFTFGNCKRHPHQIGDHVIKVVGFRIKGKQLGLF